MLLKYKKIREKKVVLFDFYCSALPRISSTRVRKQQQQQQQQQQLIRPQNTATKQRFEECLRVL